jgi:hypothetical protein
MVSGDWMESGCLLIAMGAEIAVNGPVYEKAVSRPVARFASGSPLVPPELDRDVEASPFREPVLPADHFDCGR